jgi:hypothetical protein
MAFPPPIPLRPADRPETWAEYHRRRQSIAQWRGISDFMIKGHFGSFAELALLAPYRQPATPPRPFVPLSTLLLPSWVRRHEPDGL